MTTLPQNTSIFDDRDAGTGQKRALSDHLVHIRQLMPVEAGAMRAHLLRLDHDSRHHRFGHGVSDAFINRYVDDVFGNRKAVVKACFIDGVCRGIAEAFINDDEAGIGEAAFSVERRWQGFGLGTMLFERLIRSARNRGCTKLCVLCVRTNTSMMRMAEKLSADIHFEPDGVIGEITQPRRSLFSMQAELWDDARFMHVLLPDDVDD